MKNMDFKQILQKLQNLKFQKGAFNNLFSKKINSFIIVDIGYELTLISIEFKSHVIVNGLKKIKLETYKKDEVILSSLRDFIKTNNIRHNNVILKPSLDSLLIKRIQLPALPDDELAEAIKWQLKEDISFDLSAAVMDFSIIKKTTKEDGSKTLDIICAIAQEQEVKHQVALLKQAGLTCLSVGVLPFGYEKLIERYLAPKEEVSLGILHLSDNICYISFFKNNKLQFYRELPISVDKLKDSLKGALVSHKGRVELSAEEADEVISKIGVPESDTVYKDKISSSQILAMIRPILERLVMEVRRSLSYYDSQFSSGIINKVFIAGSSLTIPNIDKFLAKELSMDIGKISLKDKLMVSSSINPESLSEVYANLGLAIDYQQNLNLLPYEFRTEKIEKLEKVSLRWVVILAILLLAVSFLFTKVRIGAYQRRLDNAKLHLETLSALKHLKVKIDELNNFVNDIRKSEPPVSLIFKKISNIASNELFFSNFSINADSKTGTVSGFIKSSNKNPDAVLTKFVRDMENSRYFSDATIDNV
ncbi:MAG: hypothetical protein FJZ11_03475, partial [Candidatus Omnitrophica bacterium]|nr:hypothetical protein [Candidatus Omnitrophota bacterium]